MSVLCRRTKIRVFKALILPVLLQGSETNAYTERLVQALLLAQSVIANSGNMANWLVSQMMIFPTRMSLFEEACEELEMGRTPTWRPLAAAAPLVPDRAAPLRQRHEQVLLPRSPRDDDPPAGVFSRRGARRRPLEGREVASGVICGCGGGGCGLGRIVRLGGSVFIILRRAWRILVVGCGCVVFVGLKGVKEEESLRQLKKEKELEDEEFTEQQLDKQDLVKPTMITTKEMKRQIQKSCIYSISFSIN
ncbi:uncharacterized protein LOC134786800 [Penaeus indicus]|uniref:uncharacterized protein LOC134786800 n=1 Tax=Penaeus indicus TaxID=29960 RepID=UPI00300D9E63